MLPAWLDTHIDRLTPQQRAFVLSNDKVASYVAGNGMGKTYAGILRCLRLACEHPGIIVLACDATTQEAAMLMQETVLYLVPPDEVEHSNRVKREVELVNGSRLLFRHLLYGRMLNEYMRGLAVDAVYLDNNEYLSYRDFLTLFLYTRRRLVVTSLESPIAYTGEVEWRSWRDLLPKEAIPVPALPSGQPEEHDFVVVDAE